MSPATCQSARHHLSPRAPPVSILPEKSTAFSVDNVRVSKILGAGLLSSQVVQGMVFRREAEGTVTTAEKAKVAVFTCPVDIAATETKVRETEGYM